MIFAAAITLHARYVCRCRHAVSLFRCAAALTALIFRHYAMPLRHAAILPSRFCT